VLYVQACGLELDPKHCVEANDRLRIVSRNIKLSYTRCGPQWDKVNTWQPETGIQYNLLHRDDKSYGSIQITQTA